MNTFMNERNIICNTITIFWSKNKTVDKQTNEEKKKFQQHSKNIFGMFIYLRMDFVCIIFHLIRFSVNCHPMVEKSSSVWLGYWLESVDYIYVQIKIYYYKTFFFCLQIQLLLFSSSALSLLTSFHISFAHMRFTHQNREKCYVDLCFWIESFFFLLEFRENGQHLGNRSTWICIEHTKIVDCARFQWM